MRAAAAAACLLSLAACGGNEPAAPVASGPPVSELRIGLSEYQLQLSAGALRPGEVTVTGTNAGSTGHDVRLRQGGQELGRTEVLSPGRSQTITVRVAADLPVELDCTVTGHADAGMVAAVAVVGG